MISKILSKKGILSTTIATTLAMMSTNAYANNSMPEGWDFAENTPYSITGVATNGNAYVGFVNISKGEMNNIPASIEEIAEYIDCKKPQISENLDNNTYELTCSNNRFAKVVASDVNDNMYFSEPISEYLKNTCSSYLKAQTSVFYTIYFFANTTPDNEEALSALSALYQYKATLSPEETNTPDENITITNINGKPIDSNAYTNKSKSYLISKLFQGYNLTKEGKALFNEISQEAITKKLNIIIFSVYQDLDFIKGLESTVLNHCIDSENNRCIETMKSGREFLFKLDKLKAQKYETKVAEYLKSKNAPVFISHSGDFERPDCAANDKACADNSNVITVTLSNNPYHAITNEVLLPIE